MSVRELRITYWPTLNSPQLPDFSFTAPSQAAAFFMPLLQTEPCEVFAMLCLTTKFVPLAYYILARGTLNACTVSPREVFQAALLTNAAYVVVAHNHPSGDPTPSPEDIDLTRRLAAAGILIGVALVDHIIVGDNRYFSFKEVSRL